MGCALTYFRYLHVLTFLPAEVLSACLLTFLAVDIAEPCVLPYTPVLELDSMYSHVLACSLACAATAAQSLTQTYVLTLTCTEVRSDKPNFADM